MLQLLHIENIAVIEQADIELQDGLTVLTGETGAGKSIIIDSIGAIMGQRTSRELIRGGAKKGFVSAVFTGLSPELRRELDALGLGDEEEGELHIQRQISAEGKTVCRVNMKPVATAVLRRLSPYLLNVHGQHDGQRLMDENSHIDFLDGFCGAGALLERYRPSYHKLLALRRQITELDRGEQERLQRLDQLRAELEEIEEAELRDGEEEALLAKKTWFDNAGRLMDALLAAQLALDGTDTVDGAAVLTANAAAAIERVAEVSPELAKLAEAANELKYLAEDLRESVGAQIGRAEFSPEERAAIEERLDEIYRLRKRYGDTVADVLAYAEQARAELEGLESSDERRSELREEYRAELQQAKQLAARLTAERKAGAKKLEKAIVAELKDLDMTRVALEIQVETGTKLASKGMDTVQFLISVNPGEPLRPLSRVASGGELSRVMLAMKNVLTAGESVGTLIFDEIDTGVSGRAAQRIAHKLREIGSKKQTLCVTHLPQIAAMGNNHLLIEKRAQGGRTFTDVHPMTAEGRAREIARMLAGDQITETTLENARELLHAAEK